MGYEGISWLERPNREDEEKTSILIKNMNIKKTDYIADIGAGSGYHVFKMAPRAKKGEVYAVDIQPEMLRAILMNSQFDKNQNIELVQGAEKTVNLPKKKFDKILMVDVYHEFNYRMEDSSVPIKKVHKMSEKQAVKEMKFVGLKLK